MLLTASSKREFPHPFIPEFMGPSSPQEAAKQVGKHSYPREKVVELLTPYNELIGNDKTSLEQLRRLLEPGSTCVVTGHQLGLFGGPYFSILKGITCLIKARELGAVPIYWLATEDHDISEISHTTLLDELGNLEPFQVTLWKKGQAIEDLVIPPSQLSKLGAFLNKVGSPFSSKASEYHLYMAQFLAYLFAGTGMVFLEPYLLRNLALPYFKMQIRQADEIKQILHTTTERLIRAGGEAVIPTNGGTLLFCKDENGMRKKVQDPREVNLKEMEIHPHRFSANVALRPLIQSGLLPTQVYVGGPSELAYHQQLVDLYPLHNVVMPYLENRHSVTLLTPMVQELLHKAKINPSHLEELTTNTNSLSQFESHTLRNALQPKRVLPERVFNWMEGARTTKKNLVKELLSALPPETEGHHFCNID